jgi:hypothetical protein
MPIEAQRSRDAGEQPATTTRISHVPYEFIESDRDHRR